MSSKHGAGKRRKPDGVDALLTKATAMHRNPKAAKMRLRKKLRPIAEKPEERGEVPAAAGDDARETSAADDADAELALHGTRVRAHCSSPPDSL